MAFPDQTYLRQLIDRLAKKVEQYQSSQERLLMLSGAALNWIGDYITDPHIAWTLETLSIKKIYLTGTGPEWNAIVLDRAKHSPAALQKIMDTEPNTRALFERAVWDDFPICIRYEEERHHVLDGMHRTIAAIRDHRPTIRAYVARNSQSPAPSCEPHVLYDLIRAYRRGSRKDPEDFVAALTFLLRHYKNVERLLRERFDYSWVPDDDTQQCIQHALGRSRKQYFR